MTKLLCATDLLPKSESAIDRAGLLAEELDAKLTLLHVVSPFASQRVLEDTLRNAIGRMKSRAQPPLWRASRKPNAGVLVGNPKRIIVNAVASERPDLLILGPHERRSAFESLQDTIPEKVVTMRQCPVLIVQQSATTAYRKLLFALDLTPEATDVVRAAERLVVTRDAQATVVHAHALNAARFQLAATEPMAIAANAALTPAQINTSLHALLARESSDPSGYDVIVAQGDEGSPVPTIARAVDTYRPHLLVIGTRGDGRLRRAMLGSVANQLLKSVRCDVLIVPEGVTDAAHAVQGSRAVRANEAHLH